MDTSRFATYIIGTYSDRSRFRKFELLLRAISCPGAFGRLDRRESVPKWEDHNKQEHYSLQLHTWAFGSEGVSSYYSYGTIHCCILTYAAAAGGSKGKKGGLNRAGASGEKKMRVTKREKCKRVNGRGGGEMLLRCPLPLFPAWFFNQVWSTVFPHWRENYTMVGGRNLLEQFGTLPLVSCQVRQTQKKAHTGEEGFNFWNGPRGVGRKKEEEK